MIRYYALSYQGAPVLFSKNGVGVSSTTLENVNIPDLVKRLDGVERVLLMPCTTHGMYRSETWYSRFQIQDSGRPRTIKVEIQALLPLDLPQEILNSSRPLSLNEIAKVDSGYADLLRRYDPRMRWDKTGFVQP